MRLQITLRGAAFHGAGRELRCAREAAYAARAFLLSQIYVEFKTHRTVWRGVVLLGGAFRSIRLQHLRAIPFVLNRPFCALNLTMH